jgi:hypothetical protein
LQIDDKLDLQSPGRGDGVCHGLVPRSFGQVLRSWFYVPRNVSQFEAPLMGVEFYVAGSTGYVSTVIQVIAQRCK